MKFYTKLSCSIGLAVSFITFLTPIVLRGNVVSANERLLQAAQDGDLVAVRSALSHKGAVEEVDVNVRGSKNRTPLMWAADTGHLDVVKYLTKKGAKINATDNRSMTALMLASYHGYTEVVEFLVDEADADVSLRGPFGKTALGLARFQGHSDIVQYLRQHGAK